MKNKVIVLKTIKTANTREELEQEYQNLKVNGWNVLLMDSIIYSLETKKCRQVWNLTIVQE